MGTWAGQGNGRAVFSEVLFECSLAERVHQADKEIPGRRNSMSKGMGLSLDCKALGMAGARGMCAFIVDLHYYQTKFFQGQGLFYLCIPRCTLVPCPLGHSVDGVRADG